MASLKSNDNVFYTTLNTGSSRNFGRRELPLMAAMKSTLFISSAPVQELLCR